MNTTTMSGTVKVVQDEVPVEYLQTQVILAARPVGLSDEENHGYHRVEQMVAVHHHVPDQPAPETSSAIDKSKYKTRLCRNWTHGQECPYGDRCVFAHGEHEKKRESSNLTPLEAPLQQAAVPPAALRRTPSTLMRHVQQPQQQQPQQSQQQQQQQQQPRTPAQHGLLESSGSWSSQAMYYQQDFPHQGYEGASGSAYLDNQSFVTDSTQAVDMGGEFSTPAQTPLSASISLLPTASGQNLQGTPLTPSLSPPQTGAGWEEKLLDSSQCSSPTTHATPACYRYEPYGCGIVWQCPVPTNSSNTTENGLSDRNSDTSSEDDVAVSVTRTSPQPTDLLL